ncbi:MAG: MCP four helix bundle domain-containing protein, partial [Zoogloeaceae bacterium]|nr:MCP four helix bundle domain-containing protein [Zoogloeaceae bacterium]
MKINTRIHILSTLAWVSLAIVGMLGFYNTSSSVDAFRQLNAETVSKLEAVLEFEISVNNMERRLYEAGSKNTFEYDVQIQELATVLAHMKEGEAEAQKWFKTYEAFKRHPDAQKLWDRVVENWPSWSSALGAGVINTLETALTNPTPGKLAAFYGEVDRLGMANREKTRVITNALSELVIFNERMRSEVAQNFESGANLHLMTQAFITLLAIAGIVFLGVTSLKSIVKPVKTVRDTTVKIAGENDLRIRVDYRANDEVGEMVEAFNGMLGKLQT